MENDKVIRSHISNFSIYPRKTDESPSRNSLKKSVSHKVFRISSPILSPKATPTSFSRGSTPLKGRISPFLEEIQSDYLRRSAERIMRVCSASKLPHFRLLGSSRHDVSILSVEKVFLEDVQKALKQNELDFESSFSKLKNQTQLTDAQIMHFIEEGVPDNYVQYQQEIFKLAGLRYIINSNLFEQIKDIQSFDKEKVLKNLKSFSKTKQDEILKKIHFESLKDVDYISFKSLKDLDPTTKNELLRNLKPVILSTNFKSLFSDDEILINWWDCNFRTAIEKHVAPPIVFKKGPENERELLAKRLSSALGLDQYLLKKIKVNFSNITFGDDQKDVIKEHKGLVGLFLFNAKPLPRDLWEEYRKLKANPKASVDRLKEVEKKLLALGGEQSIPEHLMLDLLFCSGDSHINQYLIENKEFKNIDFARFFPPSSVYYSPDKKTIHSAFRSELLDHPIAKQPIPQYLIDMVKNYDIDFIKLLFREYLVSEDEIKSAAQAQSTLIQQYFDNDYIFQQLEEVLSDNQKYIQVYLELEEKEKLLAEDPSLEPKVQDLRNMVDEIIDQQATEIRSAIKKQLDELREKIYKKIHPKAFQNFLKRIEKAQKFFLQKTSKNPAFIDLFKELYPELFVFYKRLDDQNDPFPSRSIAFKEGKIISLESIIAPEDSTFPKLNPCDFVELDLTQETF